MKRVSFRYLCFSIQAALKKVFSDSDIKLLQILFWVQMSVNSVVAKSLNQRLTGSYLMTFTNVPVLFNNTDNNNILFQKKYLQLPANIFDLEMDKAIDWITFRNPAFLKNYGCSEHLTFQRSTLVQIKLMYDTAFERPSVFDNVYFVRVNDRLYLFGIENNPVKSVDMALRTTVNPYIGAMTLDDEVMLNDEQISTVTNQCISLGRFIMNIPQERSETGTDTTDQNQKMQGQVQQPEQAQ